MSEDIALRIFLEVPKIYSYFALQLTQPIPLGISGSYLLEHIQRMEKIIHVSMHTNVSCHYFAAEKKECDLFKPHSLMFLFDR